MAKIKTTAIVADISGRINGTVFFRTKSGLIARTKVSPPNPQTPAQIAVRANMTAISQAWRDLSKGLRIAWENYSSQNPYQDPFGDSKILSGIAMFNKINGVLLGIDEPLRTTPPPTVATADFVGFGSLEINNEAPPQAASFQFSTDPAAIPANHKLVIDMTPAISPAREFVKNLYKRVGYVDETAVGPTFELLMPENIGQLSLDETVSVRGYFVNKNTGIPGSQVSRTTQVVAV